MAKINYRKLISFGKGSYIISMPKSWVEKNNLKKGDLINVLEGSAELILSPNSLEAAEEPLEITIEVENKSLDLLRAEIVSAYLNNYNTIEIMGKSLDQHILKIKEIVRNLTGLEIMEQTSTRLVARDLININDISIQNIIRRMDMITRSMIDDVILCLDKKCNYQSIEHRDVDVNRLYYLGFRTVKNAMSNPMVAKKLGMDMWRLHSDKMVMLRIEEIADRQKRISNLISEAELRDKALEEFKKIKDGLRQRYHEVMKSYYTNDKKIAYNTEITNKEFIEMCDKFFEDASKKLAAELKKGSGEPGIPRNKDILPVAKMVEHTKAATTFIKYIARTVLNMD